MQTFEKKSLQASLRFDDIECQLPKEVKKGQITTDSWRDLRERSMEEIVGEALEKIARGNREREAQEGTRVNRKEQIARVKSWKKSRGGNREKKIAIKTLQE